MTTEANTILLVGAALYLLPTLISLIRKHHNQNAIFALNLLLGWTVLGWVGALVWALTKVEPRKPGLSALGMFQDAKDGILYRLESLFSGFTYLGALIRQSQPSSFIGKILATVMLLACYALAGNSLITY